MCEEELEYGLFEVEVELDDVLSWLRAASATFFAMAFRSDMLYDGVCTPRCGCVVVHVFRLRLEIFD